MRIPRLILAGLVAAACGEISEDRVMEPAALTKPTTIGGMTLRHPNDGDTVKAHRFVYSAEIPLSPGGRATTITMTVRDKETGDELRSRTTVVNGPAANQNPTIIVRHPADGASVNKDRVSYTAQILDLPPGREVTVTLTVRDRETGDEIVTGTITVMPN